MTFSPPLIPATLIKRYKRFLADVRLENGEAITVHCANPGSMKSCAEPGWPVQISDSQNPKRKLRYTLEMLHNGKCWIGVNTHRPNRLVVEAIEAGKIPELKGFSEILTEQKYGKASRIDILLERGKKACYVEVKNVTLAEGEGWVRFPDSVTERGRKHLTELSAMVKRGHRAVMLFTVQRSDGKRFGPAREIDPAYAKALKTAYQNGVEILPYRVRVSPKSLSFQKRMDFSLD